ncbi:MAG: methylmalonyl Co-A mutase-associated GTPase MeaB [Bacteroidetes bacterium]|nr:methylmalonyl Co-A mutase-associated GTPase MeaB [Bacteroidota bacterium]
MKELDQLSANEFVTGILSGDKVIIARAITLLESNAPNQRNKALEIMELCLPHSGNSIRIGITGSPGVGKSTFIEALGNQFLQENKKLAVLAIDPSSKKSKGSILGDKTRMQELSKHENVFIRPTPAGTTIGGVASSTRECMIILEAAGYEIIMVETVGVGQSETAVYDITDVFILLLLAGAGDELQGIKRGIMEMADIILINKSDGDNMEKAKIARADVERAIHLYQPKDSGWQTTAEICSAVSGLNLETIKNLIDSYIKTVTQNGYFKTRRKQQFKQWFNEDLNNKLLQHFHQNPSFRTLLAEQEIKIENGEILPPKAVQLLLQQFLTKL